MHLISKLAWLIFPLGCGLAALWLGQDSNWDLRNYHFYIPYAFLHGRLDFDVAPGQVANFYNPLFYVPFYYLVLAWPPQAVGFFIGALQGLNGVFVFYLARHLQTYLPGIQRPWLPWVLALMAVTGAGFIAEIGTSFGDTIISLLILGSLACNFWLIARSTGPLTWQKLLVALASGLLAGLAAGLKQPFAAYAVGLCAGFLFINRDFTRNISLAFIFGLGVLAGMATSGGFWFYELWQRYGNPLFPYFNDVFQSPWAWLGPYRDARFLPRDLGEVLLFPFFFITDPFHTGEAAFRDWRIAVLYVGLIIFIILKLVMRQGQQPLSQTMQMTIQVRYLITFLVVTFAAWLKLFAIYRYLVVVEMLAPLALWCIWQPWLSNRKYATPIIVLVMLAMLVGTQPGNWGRVPWSKDYFGVTVPPLADPKNTVVLLAGYEPLSYVIPFFPPTVQFLRIHSWFTAPSPTPNRSDERMQHIVAHHRGPLFILFRDAEEELTKDVLTAYNVTLVRDKCRPMENGIDRNIPETLYFCPVIHKTSEQ